MTTTLHIPYGKESLTLTLPDAHPVQVIQPAALPPAPDPIAVVQAALAAPIGGQRLVDFKGVSSVAIAINDKTRPVPHQHLLPPLLAQLAALGLPPQRITLVIATGTHPVMPPEEYSWVLPEDIIQRYPVICHDAYDESNLLYLGHTRRHTPVYINKHYMAADLRIVVGNIEPHQFMGFSGGVKSAAIGLAGYQTINHNHAMMQDENARLGHYSQNPARQDVEEIGRMIRVDYAHNALLNDKKQIVDVLAGDPYAVMDTAIPRVRRGFQVQVPQPFDAMIVSPGGHPKDINLYQAQKGLAHAALVTKPGAAMILCAACPEGTGSRSYEQWMAEAAPPTHAAVLERFAQGGFRVGPHKAFQIARDALHLNLMTISEMEMGFAARLLLNPMPDLDSAVAAMLAQLPPGASIGVMPYANATIPILAS